MAYIIDSCEPGCPERMVGCHATCKRYKEARAKYEADKLAHKPDAADRYFIHKSKKKRNMRQKISKKKQNYKGLKQLY